jgi:formiminoglutamase
MFREFLIPPNTDEILGDATFGSAQLARHIVFFDGKEIDFSEYNIAILGVPEDRGSEENPGSAHAPDEVRRQLYKLYLPNVEAEFKVIDLGNIRQGESLKDTYFGLATVMLQLVTNKVIPVIIGGGHDLTYGQYLGYQELYSLINMVVIDERIDMHEDPERKMTADSFIMQILMHNPNYLFNYSHLGYQTYLNDPKAIETLDSLSFDCQRLGLVRADLEEVEPVLRDADMLSIDLSCIRQADAPAHANASPNGFSGEELCQITRYAGLSDKLTSIGIYELNPMQDNGHQTSQLVAQMIWYFIEGYYNRRGDYPVNLDDHLKFIVHLDEMDHELIFWKSKKTERWWMELPFGDKEKYARHQLVPCSYKDYEMATNQELPDKWMKVYTKLI